MEGADRNPTPSEGSKLPLRRAVFWILMSTMLISGSAGGALFYFKAVSKSHQHDANYAIVAILQTSPEAHGLRTGYLAELMNLSADRPSNLYAFSTKEARDKLLCCPAIKEVTVRKIRPGALHVDYKLREPIAYLGDYSNTAIDTGGVPFPFIPFFKPKNLPEIYLGIEGPVGGEFWGKPIRGKQIDLAFSLMSMLRDHCCDEKAGLLKIDLSRAYASSYGQRQIIVEFEEKVQKIVDGNLLVESRLEILRLAPDNYESQLANYIRLRSERRKITVEPKSTVIDLRLKDLAFISNF